jgi:uroporphyrinogen decarboxylase
MTGAERIKALLQNKPVDKIVVSGWLHLSAVDRYVDKFVKDTIDFTDKNEWDFIKVMENGHYFAEAYGADIQFLEDPTRWSGIINKYPIETLEDVANLPVLDPNENSVFTRELEVIKGLYDHYKGKTPILPTLFTPLTWIQEMSQSTVAGPTLDLVRNHKEELHKGLKALLETSIKLADAYIEAGADGFFIASQFASKDILTEAEFDEFCKPYEEALIEHISKKTWFNIFHVHGDKNLFIEKFVDYNVQALNWENTPHGLKEDEITSITKVRSLTDKILIGGIDQHHDFQSEANDTNEVKAKLKTRLESALEETKDNRFIFAPGCALPMNVDRSVFTLISEAANEVKI